MLDMANYNDNLYGKKILEDSFGSGNILIQVITRYIEKCLEEGITLSNIKKGLEEDIYGSEIDTNLYEDCIEKLNALIKKYDLKDVNWQLLNRDSLTIDWGIKFDFIIGNPPYVKYHELDISKRNWLRNNYKSCQLGNFDYYYAFTENAMNLLNSSGKLVYLIPNNAFKNVYGSNLREILKEFITQIYFYRNEVIFEKAVVTPCIIKVERNAISTFLEYEIHNEGYKTKIKKSQLGTNKWVFDSDFTMIESSIKFGDLFLASMPIATLYNQAFILRGVTKSSSGYFYQNKELEKEILKKAASPKSMLLNKNEYIIFPYRVENGQLHRFTEVEFCNQFPNVMAHLKKFYNKLIKRNSSNGVKWFEYGRTQAIKHQNQPKLLISTLVTNKVSVYKLSSETVPYSGIYITAKADVDLKLAEQILTSPTFMDYVKKVGTITTPHSIRITARDINNFPLDNILKDLSY